MKRLHAKDTEICEKSKTTNLSYRRNVKRCTHARHDSGGILYSCIIFRYSLPIPKIYTFNVTGFQFTRLWISERTLCFLFQKTKNWKFEIKFKKKQVHWSTQKLKHTHRILYIMNAILFCLYKYVYVQKWMWIFSSIALLDKWIFFLFF